MYVNVCVCVLSLSLSDGRANPSLPSDSFSLYLSPPPSPLPLHLSPGFFNASERLLPTDPTIYNPMGTLVLFINSHSLSHIYIYILFAQKKA